MEPDEDDHHSKRLRLRIYSEEEFDALLYLIRRVPGHRLHVHTLMRDLSNVVGPFHKTLNEEAEYWAEAAQFDMRPREVVRALRTAADAENPLEDGLIPRDAISRVNKKLRATWGARWSVEGRPNTPSLQNLRWSDLTSAEKRDLKAMLSDLAFYSQASVRVGVPKRDELDTVLIDLAQIWIEQTGQTRPIESLEANRNSRFVRFASQALLPAVGHFGGSVDAVSNRWRRFKKGLNPENS